MIKGVVFDLDNTLVDFMRMKGEAIDAAIGAMIDAGLELSYAEIKDRIDAIYKEKGIEFQYVFDSLLSDIFDRVDYKFLSAGVVAYRRAREAALVPYPHVYMTLYELLKMGMKLAVVSDAPAREAWLRLTYLNMHNIFDVVVTFEDTNERKPHPAPFTLALERLCIKPEEALMVGDWVERDIIGAKKVGMRTVFARYGDTFDTSISGGDYEANDIQDLIGIIKKENGSG
jgi:HAD superfamily hydrolase (TIGR02253 family)